ncbi:methyl-accepting chemotaxis protein [Janthinobacterium sp. Mn2066]|uniref:methyl-accepting chemotaxis protein n=1 Tax=Janthinobacterium sp. Mn2066 TaxID=3395264 RepID=UPI003BDE1357
MDVKNLRIGHRLSLSFGVVAALLAIIATLTFVRIDALDRDIDSTNNYLYPKTVLATQIKGKVTEAVISMRNAMLLSDPAQIKRELDSIETGAKIIVASINQLEKSASTDEDRAFIANLAQVRGKFVTARTRFAGLVREQKVDEAYAALFDEVGPTQMAYYGVLDKLVEHEDQLMQQSGKQAIANAASTKQLVLALTVAALAISAGVAWYVTRSITAPLANAVAVARKVADGDLTSAIVADTRDETGQLLHSLKDMNQGLLNIVSQVRDGTGAIATAANEIADGNADLSSRTEQQASSLQETAAAMEELTTTVQQNADNADLANSKAASASKVAAAGGAVVGEVVKTMSSINDSSRKIVDIIGVIDSIAFQTNILALNAAVEAARAGEAGRGFAVVATEVRSLAQRSAAAAREIKGLIDDSVDKVDSGTRLVEKAGSTMDEIVRSVRQVAEIIADISAASREQTVGIQQVNQAITQMDEATQQNAALVEQAAAASQALRSEAGHLAQVVSAFKLQRSGSYA